MEAYTDFASVYDEFMDDTPYGDWCVYLCGLLRDYSIQDGLLLELGCGTGTMSELFAQAGFDVIGVDNSPRMLEIAMEKKQKSGSDILYLLQDMREFELYGTVKAVVSVCDSINYILDEAQLRDVFRLVNNYLDPGGIFLFDFNTVYKYREVIGDAVIAENRDTCSFIWENYFYEDEQINEYDLTLFVRENPEQHDHYRKFTETHYQRGYGLDMIKELLDEAGLAFVTAYDAFGRKPVHEKSERICIIAKERGK